MLNCARKARRLDVMRIVCAAASANAASPLVERRVKMLDGMIEQKQPFWSECMGEFPYVNGTERKVTDTAGSKLFFEREPFADACIKIIFRSRSHSLRSADPLAIMLQFYDALNE